MNEIDEMVKTQLLAWPTLYHNRFDALGNILTSSCYEWVDGGLKLTCGGCEKDGPVTVDTFLEEFRDKLAAALGKFDLDVAEFPDSGASNLHRMWIAEADAALVRAEFMAANIDIVASTYWYGLGCHYGTFIRGWMTGEYRGGGTDYWPMNVRPDDVKKCWQAAIGGWLRQLVPIMHEDWGFYDDEKNEWRFGNPEDKYRAEWYDHMLTLQKQWAFFAPEDEARQRKVADQIIDEILAEEKANKGD